MHETWPANFQTASQDDFMAAFWASRDCDVFIDEAGDMVGRYNPVMQKCATKGRHWGHVCHFLTQDYTTLAPVVRGQTGHLYLFSMHRTRLKPVVEDWNNDALYEAADMPLGCCLYMSKGSKELTRINVFGGNQ